MWIVFGTKATTTRVPGGARVDRRCEQCGEQATFYEKELTETVRLYFIDVYDYKKHRVMVCGCCGAAYATDELGAPNAEPSIAGKVESAVGRAGALVERTATRVADRISGAFSGERAPEAPRAPSRRDEIDDIDEDALRRDLARLEEEEIDASEARFRELERKGKPGG